jgi:hypothetical protein
MVSAKSMSRAGHKYWASMGPTSVGGYCSVIEPTKTEPKIGLPCKNNPESFQWLVVFRREEIEPNW